MTRALRIDIDNGLYHVTSRSLRRPAIVRAVLSWRVIRPSYLTRLASGRLALVLNHLYPKGKDD